MYKYVLIVSSNNGRLEDFLNEKIRFLGGYGNTSLGPSINYVVSVGGGGDLGSPKTIYYIVNPTLKKTTRRGGVQKALILRRHSLWTAPY